MQVRVLPPGVALGSGCTSASSMLISPTDLGTAHGADPPPGTANCGGLHTHTQLSQHMLQGLDLTHFCDDCSISSGAGGPQLGADMFTSEGRGRPQWPWLQTSKHMVRHKPASICRVTYNRSVRDPSHLHPSVGGGFGVGVALGC